MVVVGASVVVVVVGSDVDWVVPLESVELEADEADEADEAVEEEAGDAGDAGDVGDVDLLEGAADPGISVATTPPITAAVRTAPPVAIVVRRRTLRSAFDLASGVWLFLGGGTDALLVR